jgi:hypothetical protein
MLTRRELIAGGIAVCLPKHLRAITAPRAHYDANQSSSNSQETILTPSNVTAGKFGKLGSWTLDGLVFSQVLYIPGVTITGSVYDILIVATLNNTIYAFNANVPGSTPLWSVNFGTGRAAWSNNTDQFFYCSSLCNIGIVGTPCVDVTGGFVYVVSATSTPNYLLHKLNLADGSAAVTAVTISGQVVGTGSTGDPTSGPNLLFSPTFSMQRPGLVLSADGSKVYVAFGGGSAGFSNPPWHGWMFGYNTSNLTQFAAFCTTPNSYGGSIWMAGGAPAMDASGNLYVVTGSIGSWDGITNFPDSVLKLSPSLALLDWFTPSNHATNDTNDYDFGSHWFTLIPGTTLGVAAGKDFNVYVIDTTCMGHLQGSGGCSLQTFQTNAMGTPSKFSGTYGGAFMSNTLWLPTTAGSIYEYAFSSGSFNTTPVATQTNSYGFPGPAQMTVSSNAGANAILWVVTNPSGTGAFQNPQPGTLRALNASTLAELWNSGSSLGTMAKFSSPTVANGKVYLPNDDNQLLVFGLLPTSQARGQVTLRGQVKQR